MKKFFSKANAAIQSIASYMQEASVKSNLEVIILVVLLLITDVLAVYYIFNSPAMNSSYTNDVVTAYQVLTIFIIVFGALNWFFIDISWEFLTTEVDNKRAAAEEKACRAKEDRANFFIGDLKVLEDNYFIKVEYRHGRWYIDYEYLNWRVGHFSVTKSFTDEGEPWEDYARIDTKYGFHSQEAEEKFKRIENKLLGIINEWF